MKKAIKEVFNHTAKYEASVILTAPFYDSGLIHLKAKTPEEFLKHFDSLKLDIKRILIEKGYIKPTKEELKELVENFVLRLPGQEEYEIIMKSKKEGK